MRIAEKITFLTAAVIISTSAVSSSPDTHSPAPADSVELSLSRAIGLGLASSEQLRMAEEDIRKAEAGITEAKSAAYPKLNISGQYGRNIKKPVLFLPPEFGQAFGVSSSYVEIGEDNDFMGQAMLEMPLWTVGRVGAAISIARSYLKAYNDREAAARNYACYTVREAYYSALLARQNLEIARRALRATGESARIARAGYEEGTVSRFDLLRAEVELSNREAPLVQAENELARSYILLRRRCGLEPDTPLELTDQLGPVESPDGTDTLLARMHHINPEIEALQSQVSMRKHNLDLQKAERYPMFNFTAYYALQSQWSNDFIPEDNAIAKNAALQIGFQIPIFDGFETKGKIRKAKADLRMAEIELDRNLRDKELAVRSARLALIDALSSLEGRREAVKLAEEAHRIALVKLKNGLATPLERLDAELAMTTARAQLAEVLYSCNIALAQLELAVGIDMAAEYKQ
ncbi:MAG: hypothetical protein GF417_02935 [Candidatus Latescibacteria bacterium]|nr:hypothetical protein [bacterium]MBD3423383.1 hypothetical protein [Candidatus Latescibacterota bacterium]